MAATKSQSICHNKNNPTKFKMAATKLPPVIVVVVSAIILLLINMPDLVAIPLATNTGKPLF